MRSCTRLALATVPLLAALAGCTRSGTGFTLTVHGGAATLDALDLTGHIVDGSGGMRTSPHHVPGPIALPTSLVAAVEREARSASFDVTAVANGAMLRTVSTGVLGVRPDELVPVDVALGPDAAPDLGATLLLGLRDDGPDSDGFSGDSDDAGQAEAFAFDAVAGGTVQTLAVFLADNQAPTLMAGLYADAVDTMGKHHPDVLLVSGALAAPMAHAWNRVPVTPTAGHVGRVNAGKRYWLAVLGPIGSTAGKLAFYARFDTGLGSEEEMRTGLGELPAHWITGQVFGGDTFDAYASE